MGVVAAMMLAMALQDAVLPTPKTPAIGWVTHHDFPDAAVSDSKSGIVEVDLSIGVDGKPVRCQGRLFGGDYRPFVAHTCGLLLKRAAFEPSIDEAGNPLPAGYRSRFVWAIDTIPRQDRYANVDAVLTVAKLPVPEKEARVVVRRVQAADGTMESCRVAIPSRSPALDRLACPAVADVAIGTPILDAAGNSVRGVRYPKVQFVEEAGRR